MGPPNQQEAASLRRTARGTQGYASKEEKRNRGEGGRPNSSACFLKEKEVKKLGPAQRYVNCSLNLGEKQGGGGGGEGWEKK